MDCVVKTVTQLLKCEENEVYNNINELQELGIMILTIKNDCMERLQKYKLPWNGNKQRLGQFIRNKWNVELKDIKKHFEKC